MVNINNSRAAVLSILTLSKACGNICYFDKRYQTGKIISQVSVLMIEYLVAVSLMNYIWCHMCYFSALIAIIVESMIEKSVMNMW